MQAVDYFAIVAAILCTARLTMTCHGVLRQAVHVYAALVIGIGIGMFTREDGECKVFIAVGLSMVLVEALIFACVVLCPGCVCFLESVRRSIMAALNPRITPGKVERMDVFYDRSESVAGVPMKPPPPPPKKG